MHTVTTTELQDIIGRIFIRHGTPNTIAEQVSASLVQANLSGHDSHGAVLAPVYVKKIADSEIEPDATPVIREQEGAVTKIDCRRGYGNVGAVYGSKVVAEEAKKHGVATVVLEEVNHVGRVGEYGSLITKEDCVSMIIVSGTGPDGLVAPYGGSKRIFGSNPIAWSFPRTNKPFPILVDFATAQIAAGKVSIARWAGKQVRSDALLDKDGKPTTDPNDFYDGGTLLPFGEHKGGGLMFAIEAMANLFCGFAPGMSKEHRLGNPVVMTAWNIEAFSAPERFDRLLGELCANVKSNPPIEGIEEVLLPGEFEYRTAQERQSSGIPLPEPLWEELKKLSR